MFANKEHFKDWKTLSDLDKWIFGFFIGFSSFFAIAFIQSIIGAFFVLRTNFFLTYWFKLTIVHAILIVAYALFVFPRVGLNEINIEKKTRHFVLISIWYLFILSLVAAPASFFIGSTIFAIPSNPMHLVLGILFLILSGIVVWSIAIRLQEMKGRITKDNTWNFIPRYLARFPERGKIYCNVVGLRLIKKVH
jgi:uncharacterized membrane protein